MSAQDVPVLSAPDVPSAVQFDASKEFHTHTQQKDMDSAFLGRRRPWVQEKVQRDTRKEREALSSLLATSGQANYGTDCVDKLIAEEISFHDLASLTDEDLELFGYTNRNQRAELINMFRLMPNQDPSYQYICDLSEASGFNNRIISNATSHLIFLRSSLAATNYKLQVMPPEDVVVGDKFYASRFALKALSSVKLITDELAKDLHKLENLTAKMHSSPKEKKPDYMSIAFFCTAIAIGTVCAWWWWSKHNFNIHRISIKN